MATTHDLPLVTTIAVGMSFAFIFGLIASKLRISPIVGYLLAGIIIGPFTPGFVADVSIAEQLAEIGIVLLMFGVGLHFSLDDLNEVKNIAIPGAVVQIAAAMTLGAGVGHLWGWPLSSSLLFGLALSVASTVVLLRALEEHNIFHTAQGRIAIGWLIVEDLVMILALVLIPALAMAGADGNTSQIYSTLGIAIGKMVLFVAFMLVAGKRYLPRLLSIVTMTQSRELFTLAVIVSALGVAFAASKLFGVSLALGAFFAGMMIRESDMNHEVADRALPFQDAFAVLFFVAVGMLFDPQILIDEPLRVLVVVAIIMIGKSLAALAIVILFRYPLKTALLVSAGLAQIGEFSFILIALGAKYGLLSQEGSNLIMAGALISIALNPMMFHGTRLLFNYVGDRPRLANMFNMWDSDLSHLSGDEKQSLRNLVILVGWGAVGKLVVENIKSCYDLVIIDNNRARVEALREDGYHAIAGDGGRPETLREAAVEKAFAIVAAVPDPFEARRIVENAKTVNPNIKVIVRAQNAEEVKYFQEQNVDLAVTAPEEVARRMTAYLGEIKTA